jgi:hypothetical protein
MSVRHGLLLGVMLISLTACSSRPTGPITLTSPATGVAPAATDGTSSAVPSPAAPSPAAPSATAGDGTPAGNGTAQATAGPSAQCTPAHLALSFRLPPTGDIRQATVLFTNTGPQTCHLKGFPGVDLIGPDHSVYGPRYQLPRSNLVAATVELPPRGSAHATIQVLATTPGSDVSAWTPTTVLITPPDATVQQSAPWPAGVAVVRQDGATHPGTFVNPLLPGAA